MLQIPVPPAPPGVVISTGPTVLETVLVVGLGVAVFLLLLPLVRALARRLEGRHADAASLEALHDTQARLEELDQLQLRVGELEERLEFTERLLARQRDLPRIEP